MYKFWFYLFWFLLSFSQFALAESNRGVEEVLVNDWTQNQHATQHALVVGLDKYKEIRNLEGAVNDAKLLSSALRNAGVKLITKFTNFAQ